MSTYIGYGNRIEADLRALLGPNYWGSDINFAGHLPFAEYPNFTTGAMEHGSVGRRLVVIEGETERMQPYLDAIANVHQALSTAPTVEPS